MEMSGLNNHSFRNDRAGVVIGTGVGGIQTLEDQHNTIENKGARRVSPQFVPKMISNIAGGHLSLRWNLPRSKPNSHIGMCICYRCNRYRYEIDFIW